ncbi:HAD-IA family hydrolase [Roseibacillus persicicus]|uniref:HAD-IA family hydrolase n=1 Tax=Roseibacillus persicicus TaxID=454148 RepID=UPI00398B4BAF
MQAIFLDAAGTLFDLAEPVGAVYARFADQHELALTEKEAEFRFRKAFQSLPAPVYLDGQEGHESERQWWRDLVGVVVEGAEGERFEEFFESLFAYYERPEAWRLFPETLSFLDRSKDRFRLAVVSNFDGRLHTILEGLALCDYFELVVSSADARARKPDEKIFQFALGKMNLSPSEVMHVGDSRKADYEGALQMGLRAWHLQRGKGGDLLQVFEELD